MPLMVYIPEQCGQIPVQNEIKYYQYKLNQQYNYNDTVKQNNLKGYPTT